MRIPASVLTAPFTVERRMIEVPQPSANELVVRVLATGVCGSDVATYRGLHPYKRAPVVLGHELAGVVEHVGPDVGVEVGAYVCANSFSPCDDCERCRGGQANLCCHKRTLNDQGWHGSFADQVLLRDNMVLPLPREVSPVVGALVEPMSVALHAMRRVEKARALTIIGAGNIGLACLLCARRLGWEEITCVDVSDEHGRLALELGASRFLKATGGVIEGLPGVKSEVTLVAAGYEGAMADAARATRAGGEIVVVAYFEQPERLALNDLVRGEHSIRCSALCTIAECREVIAWITQREVTPLGLVTRRLPLGQAGEALRLAASDERCAGKIVLEAGGQDAIA